MFNARLLDTHHTRFNYHINVVLLLQVLSPGVAESLQGALSHLEVALRCAHEKDSLMHFVPEEEVSHKVR